MIRHLKILLLVILGFSPVAISASDTLSQDTDQLYVTARECFVKGQFDCVRDRCRQIIKIIPNSKSEIKAKAYNLLGAIGTQSGNLVEAFSYYEMALLSLENNSPLKGSIMNNMALVKMKLGDYDQAITYNNAVLSISNDENLRRLVYNNLSLIYYNAGSLKESLASAKKSLDLAHKINFHNLGDTYLHLAFLMQDINEADSADYYYQLAIRNSKSTYGNTHYKSGIAYFYYAEFLYETGKSSDANSKLKNAFQIFNQTVEPNHIMYVSCYRLQGLLFSEKGMYAQALEMIDKGYSIFNHTLSQGNEFSDTENVLPNAKILELLKAKAQILESWYIKEGDLSKLRDALQNLDYLTSLIQKLQVSYQTFDSKLFISKNESFVYKYALTLAAGLYDETDSLYYLNLAFKFSELERYSVLREFRETESVSNHIGISDRIKNSRADLQQKITQKKIQIDKERMDANPDHAIINDLSSQLYNLTRELEQLNADLAEKYPELSSALIEAQPPDINEVRRSISDDQSLIQYSSTDSTLFIFVIDKDKAQLIRRPVNSKLKHNIQAYREIMESVHSLPYDDFYSSSRELYTQLVAPVEYLIEAKAEIIIVPDQLLSQISFDALLTAPFEKNVMQMYRNEPYLLRKFAIGYAFSSSMLINSENTEFPLRKNFIGYAPDYSNSPLDNIPSGFETTKKISRRFMGKAIIRKQATEEYFKANNKYNIVALYAHGEEDTVNAELSRLYFYPQDSLHDGILHAYEINSLKMETNLISLIACHSGSGKVVEGEGVMSIGRSFALAGCPAMVMSLWSAAAYPSHAIMDDFYWQILKGERKTEALRKAKLKYISEVEPVGIHPRFWAGIVVVGNPEPILRNYLIKVLFIPLFLLLLLVVGFRIRKRLL